jgi:hypothetical protein
MDGWLSFFSINLDGLFFSPSSWMDVLVCCRAFVVLSLTLLPLLSRLCVAVHCSDFIFCNVFDASLPKIYHCLLIFVAVFFSPTPLSFLFVRKFSFVSVLEQPSLEAFFVSFWSRVEKEPQEFVLLQGKNSNNNNNNNKENKGKVNKNKENNVHCPFFV